jgi:hypothetical protein
MGGLAVHKESAGAHLRAAWLRRDIDALHHLYAYCEISSITLPMLGDRADDVHDVAQNAVQLMRAELEADKEIAEGVLAAGLYYNALLGWENTDDFDEINGFVTAASSALERIGAGSSLHSVSAARQMLESIPFQCRTEEARLCACSHSMQLIAQEVIDYLEQIVIPAAGAHHVDDLLLELVRRDASNATEYHALLADVVSPLAGRFAEVLVDVTGGVDKGLSRPRAKLKRELRTAVPRVRRVANDMSAAGEVLGGELSVQADALERMADALDAPSLVLDHGQLIYVYPFTLTEPAAGAGFRALGEYHLELGADELVSIPLRFEAVQRSDAWDSLAAGASEVFTAFEDRGELVLADGYELRFRPKWVEMDESREELPEGEHFHSFGLRVVLGSHGGHYVHLQTQIAERDGSDAPDPWSGAHVDQWVRRLSPDAGADRISLHHHGEPVAAWDTLHELAQSIAVAVDRVEHPGAAVDEEADDLVGSTVLFVADGARVIEPNGRARRLLPDDDLAHMTGYSALMASTRYLPASVEEWIRLEAPPPHNLLAGLRPVGDVLIANGDVMTLLPFGSPNWVALEQVEMLEFAVSLHGYLQHLSDRLRRRLRGEELAGDRPTIEEVTADIRVGNQVLELLRSRGLMRSRYHSELLARIFAMTGAGGLDARVEETVQALRDVRRELEEEERNRLSESLDLTLFWLTVVTVFIAVHQFVASFFAEDVGSLAEVGVVALAASTTAALVLGYQHLRRNR